MMMRPAVIGVGNEWRGDDGVGPAAVAALVGRLPDDVDLLVLDGEPARLVEAWDGRPWVVVIDAVRTGAAPGVIHEVDADAVGGQPIQAASSHGAGLAAAVALGRALGRLPGELVLVGIEPAMTDHGNELSAPVAASLGCLLHRVERAVSRHHRPVPE